MYRVKLAFKADNPKTGREEKYSEIWMLEADGYKESEDKAKEKLKGLYNNIEGLKIKSIAEDPMEVVVALGSDCKYFLCVAEVSIDDNKTKKVKMLVPSKNVGTAAARCESILEPDYLESEVISVKSTNIKRVFTD